MAILRDIAKAGNIVGKGLVDEAKLKQNQRLVLEDFERSQSQAKLNLGLQILQNPDKYTPDVIEFAESFVGDQLGGFAPKAIGKTDKEKAHEELLRQAEGKKANDIINDNISTEQWAAIKLKLAQADQASAAAGAQGALQNKRETDASEEDIALKFLEQEQKDINRRLNNSSPTGRPSGKERKELENRRKNLFEVMEQIKAGTLPPFGLTSSLFAPPEQNRQTVANNVAGVLGLPASVVNPGLSGAVPNVPTPAPPPLPDSVKTFVSQQSERGRSLGKEGEEIKQTIIEQLQQPPHNLSLQDSLRAVGGDTTRQKSTPSSLEEMSVDDLLKEFNN